MAGIKPLEGLSEVLKNLNKAIEQQRLNTKEGLTEAALVVKADSVRGTPIDLGNLRNSAYIMVTDESADNQTPKFTGAEAGQMADQHASVLTESRGIVNKGKNRFNAIVGYSANYAWWVHEMPATFNFNSGSNKFLLKALLKNKQRIQKILIKWASIKK